MSDQQAASSSVGVEKARTEWAEAKLISCECMTDWANFYAENLLAALERAQQEIAELRQEIGTWHKIWNDVDLLSGRVEAMRNGTADLGKIGAFRLGQSVPPESGQAQRGQGR